MQMKEEKNMIWNCNNKKRCEKVVNIVSRFKCISFDLFDTLITRCVDDPKDIFNIVQYAFKNIYGENGIENFKDKRIEAQIRARQDLNREITLDEIYMYFNRSYNYEILRKYKGLEIEIEKEACQLNNINVKKTFDLMIKNGNRVIITSDMYLPLWVLEEILKKNNIKGYSAIYLSCEIGYSKATGSVYDYLVSKENVNKREIIHIGDNWRCDYYCAQRKGIKAIWLRTKKPIR